MNIKFKILILLLFFGISSCKTSYREKNASYFDISEPLSFIESNVKNTEKRKFEFNIQYGHFQKNYLKAILNITRKNVLVKTQTKSGNKKLIDTIFLITKNNFLKEIEYQKLNSKNEIILAGDYQDISVVENDNAKTFPTTRIAMGLVRFLEKAKTN